jgi:outer membrane receptor for ferrienterochelin and colicin
VFEGIEVETKANFFKSLHWQGSYTFQTNRDGNKQNNVSLAPNHLMKLGVSYDITPDLQLSVFDAFVSKAKVIPNKIPANPAAGSYHNLSVNGNYRLNSLINLPHTKQITFSLYLDNLLNERINYTGLAGNNFNSYPGQAGRTIFGQLALDF